MATVYRREGKGWRIYNVVRDGRSTIIDMSAALLSGFNVRRIEEQGADAWPDMTEAEICTYFDTYRTDDQRVPDAERDTVLALEARKRAEGLAP